MKPLPVIGHFHFHKVSGFFFPQRRGSMNTNGARTQMTSPDKSAVSERVSERSGREREGQGEGEGEGSGQSITVLGVQ